MFTKKGQSASAAAVLVLLITIFLVLYILFLPPADRDALLGGPATVYPGGPGAGPGQQQPLPSVSFSNDSLMDVSPGRLDYLPFNDFNHPIPSMNLFTTGGAETIYERRTAYVKNGVFDAQTDSITFRLDDPRSVSNVVMSFNVEKGQGRLTMKLNGNTILDESLGDGASQPIRLLKSDLQSENVLDISVSEVGWKFWTTNEYQIENIQIVGDVTETSGQTARSTFLIEEAEKLNMARAYLSFIPDCNPSSVGSLQIHINRENLYSQIPDCGTPTTIQVNPGSLLPGDNEIVFSTARGSYRIDAINIHTELKQAVYPTYYFDLPPEIFEFSFVEKDIVECGDADGICPIDCNEDDDIDCCFRGGGNFWCDVEPARNDDRCAPVIDSSDCGNCIAGYEDRNGYPPEECEEQCGDDTDDACPSGCSKLYDKDCCFEESPRNFWCDDVPTFGIENVCEQSLSPSECDDCPSGYESEESTFGSVCTEAVSVEPYVRLRRDYRAKLVLLFLDDRERKQARVFINGFQFYMDTTLPEYVRYIDPYVEDGTNAIKIEPESTLDVRKMQLYIEQSP